MHGLKPHERLERHWLDTKARITTRAPPGQSIEGLERKYGISFPHDFRDYLSRSCPQNEIFDRNYISWWPLDQIKNIVDEYPHPIRNEAIAKDAARYLFFADYSIWCWAWAIACGEDENRGRIAVISGHDRFVADSFEQFVELYIADPKKLS
jgi:hypothetical protein